MSSIRKIDNFKIRLLIICFLLTSLIIYWRNPESKPDKKREPLTKALTDINGWTMNGSTQFEKNVVDSLKLDDYVNQSFTKKINEKDTLNLYIGYYYTGGKIGAAHDPLVCFPGQGWIVKGRDKGILKLDKKQDFSVSYSTMIVEKGQEKQLILYWFQSYDKSNPDTFSQKISSLWAKISNKGEDNAFVRISISIGDEPIEKYKGITLDFVKDFYPIFLNYIQN